MYQTKKLKLYAVQITQNQALNAKMQLSDLSELSKPMVICNYPQASRSKTNSSVSSSSPSKRTWQLPLKSSKASLPTANKKISARRYLCFWMLWISILSRAGRRNKVVGSGNIAMKIWYLLREGCSHLLLDKSTIVYILSQSTGTSEEWATTQQA